MAMAADELRSSILQNPDLPVWEVTSQKFAPPPTSEGRTSQVLKFDVKRRNREAADQKMTLI
jgi:hypothetical protein